ncbi:MAG: hypothetical protein ACODAJ_07110 [Planctomycetota bacterium]
MRAPIFALLDRSLRLDNRALVPYLMRLGLLVFTFFSLIVAHVRSLAVGAPGLGFFAPIVHINIVFIALLGVGYFSTVIAEEKEEMTLGLLRLTGLNAMGIILGKSASRVIGGLMLLLAQVPFTLLAVTLGGVSRRQVFAAYATLMAFMVLVGAIALLASVVARNTVRAAAATLVLTVAFLVLGPIGTGALSSWPGGQWYVDVPLRLSEWLYTANPFVRAAEILKTGFTGSVAGIQVLSDLGLAVGCFVLAAAVFGLATREQQTAAPSRGLALTRRSRLRWLRVERAWENAVAWKDFHFMAGGRFGLIARGVVLALLGSGIVALFAALGQPMPLSAIGALLIFLPLVLAALEFIAHGSRAFRQELTWHTLPKLMLLPVSPSRLVWSKYLGFLPVLIPYGACFALGTALAFVGDPNGFVEGLVDILKTGLPWYLLANLVAFVHFVMLMSLFVRRAAVPVAFLVWLIATWRIQGSFAGVLMADALGTGVFCTVMSVVVVVLTGLIHWGMCARLDRIAGD